jgi:hypothetical protein
MERAVRDPAAESERAEDTATLEMDFGVLGFFKQTSVGVCCMPCLRRWMGWSLAISNGRCSYSLEQNRCYALLPTNASSARY